MVNMNMNKFIVDSQVLNFELISYQNDSLFFSILSKIDAFLGNNLYLIIKSIVLILLLLGIFAPL